MRKLAAALLLAPLALLAGTSAGGTPDAILALDRGHVVRLDPATLARLPGGRQEPGAGSGGWAYSPDRSRLALGINGRDSRVVIVDATRLRRLAVVPKPGISFVLAWLAPRRLIAVGDNVDVIDPVARAVIGGSALGGVPVAARQAGRSLVVLVRPAAEIGVATVARVDAEGRVRTAATRIGAGFRIEDDGAHRSALPGLAVVRGHAFVVGDGLVADVDLGTMAVRHHTLATRSPAAAAKGSVPGSFRQVVVLGDGRLAVSGEDVTGAGAALRTEPAGVTVVDPRSWRATSLAGGATRVAAAGSLLFAFGGIRPTADTAGRGVGLRAYGLDGRGRFHLFGTDAVWWLRFFRDRAYTSLGQGVVELSLPGGRIVRRFPGPMPELLVGPMRELDGT